MDCSQFKDPVSHMCFAGAVVVFWSVTQELFGWQVRALLTNIFVTEISEFSEKI